MDPVTDPILECSVVGSEDAPAEDHLDVSELGPEPFHAVFIRAPKITRTGHGVDVVARLGDGSVVAARQGSLLATSFHPELTHDGRFHRYFLSLGKK